MLESLDTMPFVGLTVTNVHTGYNAAVAYEEGNWSPHEFGTSPSEAIEKVLRLHGPVVRLAPPREDAPVVALAPPPY